MQLMKVSKLISDVVVVIKTLFSFELSIYLVNKMSGDGFKIHLTTLLIENNYSAAASIRKTVEHINRVQALTNQTNASLENAR